MPELHPLTKLMLARMESHPEEFELQLMSREPYKPYPEGYSRWEDAIKIIRSAGGQADKDAIKAALDAIHMDEAHRWAMDELTNGPQRRAEVLARKEAEHLQNMQQYSAAQQARTSLFASVVDSRAHQQQQGLGGRVKSFLGF